MLLILAFQVAASGPSLSIDEGEVSFDGLPAASAAGWVAYAEEWSGYDGSHHLRLIVERANGKSRKTIRLSERKDDDDVTSATEVRRRKRAVSRAKRLLRRHKFVSLTRHQNGGKLAYAYDKSKGTITATRSAAKGFRRVEKKLPTRRVAKYCCDAESMTGKCTVEADPMEAHSSEALGVLIVSYGFAMHAADGCETEGSSAVIRF